jgi:hypothetical protein
MAKPKRKNIVVPFRGAIPAHGVPNVEVVEFLHDLLKMAKAGAITGVGAFWVGPAEAVFKSYAPGTASQHDMLAGATMLAHQITQTVLSDV